jgi:SAM-dependent methyltransferase
MQTDDRASLVDPYDYYRAAREGNRAERAFHPRRLALLRSVADFEGRRVLELGSGTGVLAIPLAQAGAQVTAVDVDAGHLGRLRDYASEAGVSVETVLADARQLPFDEDSWDVVLCASLVHLLPEPGPLIREVERVCRRDGQLVIAGPWHLHPKNHPLVKRLLRGKGPPQLPRYRFDVPLLSRYLLRSTLQQVKLDPVIGYVATRWVPDRKPF